MAPATLTSQIARATGTLASAFALTTTFTAPTQCAQSVGGLTMLQNDGFRIWLNAPLPVPGTTIVSCYPNEFASSFLLQKGGVSQGPFSPLVCPQGYTTQGPFTSNYIACCPSGWDGFAPASDAPSDRPAFGGTCYTNIFNKPIQITSYDLSAVKASSIFTATGTADQAFAYPYEGFALGVAIVASTAPTAAASNGLDSSATLTSSITSFSSTTAAPGGTSGLSNSTVLAGVIIGSIIAVLLLISLIVFIFHYRKKRMLPISARGGKGRDYPEYADHIRLNNDSPTPMIYLSQPPKVVTDWYGERRDKGVDMADAKRYEAGGIEVAAVIRPPVDRQFELGDQNHDAKMLEDRDLHELPGGDNIIDEKGGDDVRSVPESKRQTVYEMDAAVDAMMGEMIDMMKSKKLPPLPVPRSPLNRP